MNEPYSHDAEMAVLGALLLKPESFWRIADRLADEDFSRPKHKALFTHLAQMIRAGSPVDVITIGEQIGDLAWVIDIANNTPGAANVVAYADRVASLAQLRRVRQAGRQIAALEDDCAAAEEAARLVAAVARPAMHAVQEMPGALKDWYAQLERRYTGETPRGVATGLQNLDAITGGLQPGDLVLLAARPSMGKTAFALHLAHSAALDGHGVFIATLEMTTAKLMDRFIAARAHIASDYLRRPADMEQEGWSRITAAIVQLQSLSIRFDESACQTVDSIIAKARQAHAVSPVRVLLIDYLQLIQLPAGDRHDLRLGEITRRLKALAKETGWTVVLLSQLNRDCEKRQDKRPILSDLRDSGSVEQDADLVIMLYRDEYYHDGSMDVGFTEILVRKNRDGATGTVPVRSNLTFGIYTACDGLPSGSVETRTQRAGWGRKVA